MIPTDRALDRRLRARVRRAIADTPGLRRKRRWPNGVTCGRRLLRIVFLPTVAWLFTRGEASPDDLVQFACGWTLFLYLLRASDIQLARFNSARQAVGYLLPVSDSCLHAAVARDALRKAPWMVYDWTIALLAAALMRDSAGAGDWLVVLPAAVAQALAATAFGALAFTLFPRVSWSAIHVWLAIAVFILPTFWEDIPPAYLPDPEILWRIFEHTPPMALAELSDSAGRGVWTGWAGLIAAMFFSLAIMWIAYRRSRARYDPLARFDPEEACPALRPPTAPDDEEIRAILRQPAAADYAARGRPESWFVARLSEENRLAVEALVPGDAPFRRSWLRAAAVVLVALLLPHAGAEPGWMVATVLIGGAFGIPILGGRWKGLSRHEIRNEQVIPAAHFPLSLGRLARTALRINFWKIVFVLPLIVAGLSAVLGPAEGISLGLRVAVFLFASQPLAILVQISQSTNDTRARRWSGPASFACFIAIAFAMLIASTALLAGNFSVLTVGSGLALLALGHGTLHGYLAIAARGGFDLVSLNPQMK